MWFVMSSNNSQALSDADDTLDRVFGALSDRTRRTLINQLSSGAARVTELAEPHDMSLQSISKHIKVLEKAGLVSRQIDGRVHRCSFAPESLANAASWLETYRHFWAGSLDSLAAYLESDGDPKP